MAGRRIAAGAIDLFEDNGGFGDAQTGAAIGFGQQDREVAGVGHSLHEGVGIGMLLIQRAPVFVAKAFAQAAHAITYFGSKFFFHSIRHSRGSVRLEQAQQIGGAGAKLFAQVGGAKGREMDGGPA